MLIAGSGIGGLASALALARHGIGSHVFEKRSSPSEDGAGIQIGPNGVHALRCLGVAGKLEAVSAAPEYLTIMDGVSGQQLTRLNLGPSVERRHGAPYWTVHRADLHSALLAAAKDTPLIKFSLGCEVLQAASHPGRVQLDVSDGNRPEGSALIAADGLWSRLRQQNFGSAPPSYAGSCAYRAVVNADQIPGGLSASSTYIWLSPRAHAVHYPVRAGQEIAIVAVLASSEIPAGWGVPEHAEHILSGFSHAPVQLRALLERAVSWRGWPLMTMRQPKQWSAGRVALLGDASHPVLPFLAQGAVMALEDALVLARHVGRSQPGAVAAALSDYGHERAPRTLMVAAASQRNGRMYHLDGALRVARNALLRAAPPDRLIATYDWLYGWKAPDAREH